MGFLMIICTYLFVVLVTATGMFRRVNDNSRANHQGTALSDD